MKAKVKVVYLDKCGYKEFKRELAARRSGRDVTDQELETEWRRTRKKEVDGIQYAKIYSFKEALEEDAQAIAERYGCTIYEEVEWATV